MEEFRMQAIGYIRSSYTDTGQIPKGLGATHTMDGRLKCCWVAAGLQDIEGFSHLFVVWVFRSRRMRTASL